MDTVLAVLAVSGVVAAGAGAAAAWVQQRRRVGASRLTRVPVAWRWAPSRAARRHRRLVRLVRIMRCAVPPPKRRQSPTILHELADELHQLAVELDRALLMASPMRGNAYRNRLAHLDLRIGSLEAATQRLGDLAQGRNTDGDVPWEERMRRAEVRIHAFEHAWTELGNLDSHRPMTPSSAPASPQQAQPEQAPPQQAQPHAPHQQPTIPLPTSATPAPTVPLRRFSSADHD